MRHAEQIPPEPVLDAASISHIVIANDLKEPLADMMARGHERVFDDGLVRIFRRVSLPRYFFTSEFQLTKKRYALQDIGAPHAPRDIIVESEPPFASRSSVDDDRVVVKVEHFSHNSVRLSLVAPHPGYVYMSESFLPGWRAVVNGTESPIQPANYAFRAVAVPAGPINLELKYVPPGLLPGLAVAAASLLVVASLLTYGARSRAPGHPRHYSASSPLTEMKD